jgi:hypothetical protein
MNARTRPGIQLPGPQNESGNTLLEYNSYTITGTSHCGHSAGQPARLLAAPSRPEAAAARPVQLPGRVLGRAESPTAAARAMVLLKASSPSQAGPGRGRRALPWPVAPVSHAARVTVAWCRARELGNLSPTRTPGGRGYAGFPAPGPWARRPRGITVRDDASVTQWLVIV